MIFEAGRVVTLKDHIKPCKLFIDNYQHKFQKFIQIEAFV